MPFTQKKEERIPCKRDELLRTIGMLRDSIKQDRIELRTAHPLPVSKRFDLHCRINASFNDLTKLQERLDELNT
jgi:hypothetical protein